MRIYTVHLPPSGDQPLLVKEGFCWPAFLFTVLWALWHRMWGTAALLFVVGTALDALVEGLGLAAPAQAAVGLAYLVVVGYLANDLRRRSLWRRGYLEAGVVAGPSREAAELRFLDLAGAAKGGTP